MSVAKVFNRSAGSKGGSKSSTRTCILKPFSSDRTSINLCSGKQIIGRSRDTGIEDVCCSKRQLELDVDLESPHIKLRVIGMNPCSVNGMMLMQDTKCQLEHGDVIEFVYGKHQYELQFQPPPKDLKREEKSEGNLCQIEIKETGSGRWESLENGDMIVYTDDAVKASDKIAGYDVDGTIITTKSGNVFPKHTDDWQILYAEIPKKLKLLYESGYKICFFTNQGGIGSGKIKLYDFKRKIQDILKKLSVPIQVFVAIEDGHYRKPLTGMWKHLVEHKNDNIGIDLGKSFFVGDAAGRPESGNGKTKRRKDHSLADRRFAANIGVSFYTPEEHFMNRPTEQYLKPDYKPSEVVTNKNIIPLLEPDKVKLPADNREMIIMVGLPGSGKSFFCKEHLGQHNYVIANADKVGNTQSCLRICEKALAAGKSCVVDNTNVDVESRKKFLALAKQYNIPCRCFVMNVQLDLVRHNIKYRHLTDTNHSKINEMVFNMMKKKYTAPTVDEGFTHIIKVNLKPNFQSKAEEELYKLYLLEK